MFSADYKICHECGYVMEPCKVSETFRPYGREEIKINGIKAYRCIGCGEIIYSDKEVRKMESFVKGFCAGRKQIEKYRKTEVSYL